MGQAEPHMSQRDRQRLADADRMVVGLQPVREMLRARPDRVLRVVIPFDPNPRVASVGELAAEAGVTLERVAPAELDRLARGAMHQGIVAFARALELLSMDDWLEALVHAERPYALALDGIMDPQNFGAAIRSAVALGGGFVAWPEHASAPLSTAAFRASAGAIEHAKLARVPSLPKLLTQAIATGVRVIALDVRATQSLASLGGQGPAIVIIGAEDRGPRKAITSLATLAHIPMSGRIASLNASVAAAIALYQVSQISH